MKKSGFRNNHSKCSYNDTGYCKFKEECRKLHSSSICQNDNCDKSCPERHPKECKFREKCKFHGKGLCAFSHETVDNEKNNFEKRMKDLENVFALHKAESEERIKSVSEVIKNVKKEYSENVKNLVKEIADLKKVVEDQKMLNDKAIITADNKCNKSVKDAIDKHDKSVKEAFEKTIKQIRVDVKSTAPLSDELEENNVNINEGERMVDNKKKAKLSKSKIKELKEKRILETFKKDCAVFGEMRINCGLDVKYKTCRKCDFETHSEYLLRIHKERDHSIKQTFQNLILGYECDLQSHIEVLKPMEEPIDTFKCTECDLKLCSEGKIEMHKVEHHQELYTYQG